MLFNSYHFIVFFPIVLLVYFIIPRKLRYIWLLVASYYFYMSWNVTYSLLIAFSTLITYIGGLLLDKTKKIGIKKLIVGSIFTVNIGILFTYKYLDFFVDISNDLMKLLNVDITANKFDLILPVGISFYTFQALSYIMDVYRGEIKIEKNIAKYALFVSFFPQLVAGPIERSKNLLSQVSKVDKINLWNYNRIANGLILMCWGFFQKMVIADRVAIIVNNVYNSYWKYDGVELVVATVLFSIQIYCDFASYSTIAIGAANVMGFNLMENFNTPYFAISIKDFWSRWHISLSTWFKDYLYIPLGGNRCKKPRYCFNIFLTFLVSGLWHGASWSFVVWGMLHGLYQILSTLTTPVRKWIIAKTNVKKDVLSYKLGQMIITFLIVNFTWVFFRAETLTDAVNYLTFIFTKFNIYSLLDNSIFNLGLNVVEWRVLIFAIIMLFFVDLIRYNKKQTIDVFLSQQNLWFRWLVVFVIIISCFVFGVYGKGADPSAFLYFQF